MFARKPKIVLYQPQQANQGAGHYNSFDLLPLEMLHIASEPLAAGYEVELIDASLYSVEEGHRRALEACRDALVFATTSMLGYMVFDSEVAARKVKQAYPRIHVITGGWFPTSLPEPFLETGVHDAICFGQGEHTFLDYIRAVECGAALDQVQGLMLWRDGQVVRTEHRAAVGWDKLRGAAWQLIDFAPYRERQLRPGARESRNRMVAPPSVGRGANYVGASYFASFGCPEPCTFCGSPFFTGQRWKAMPAERMLDELQELDARWGGLHAIRFMDANWAVHEKRVREFCEGLLARGLRLHFSATIEIHSILSFQASTLDLLRDAGLYVAQMGGEAATEEMLIRTGKNMRPGDALKACREMHRRGIVSSLTNIIGYPHETAESMLATLHQARDIVAECPTVSAHVYPYRPIPGSDMYQLALEMGYEPPRDLKTWGEMLEMHCMETWKDNVPPRVLREWRLYYQYASFFHGLVRNKRGLFEKLAEWRMKRGEFRLPLDLKAFYLADRVFGWAAHKEDQRQHWIMQSENQSVTMAEGVQAAAQ